MSDNDLTMIPRVVFESEMARWERNFKRLVIIILALIVLLVGTNIGWMVYESQFEDIVVSTQDVEQQADGGDNHFIGGDYYGNAAESQNNNG